MKKNTPHQQHKKIAGQRGYDIALLELLQEVDVSVYTPVCLPKSGESFVGKTALLTGMYLTKQTSEILNEISSFIFDIDNSDETMYLYMFRLGTDRKCGITVYSSQCQSQGFC